MTKRIFFSLILLISLFAPVCADDYKWDLIDALYRNDLEKIENIIRTNINTMQAAEKRLVMNFAMNYSSGENTVRVCELLLKYGIRPTSFDLYTAIDRNRQNSAVQFILQNGAVPNGEILLLTMEKQRFDLARQFIESGVDVNYHYPLTSRHADGMTPLLYASKWNNLEMTMLLAERGANLNARAVNGDTALSIAQKNSNDAIVNFLIQRGAVETANNAQSNTGIAGMNNQAISFQSGSYRLSGGSKYIRFSGNAASGTINYVDNSISDNGIYRITGNSMTILMSGRTFTYRLDSNESFSGNGEIWIRSGN
jgi:hypothetical protein